MNYKFRKTPVKIEAFQMTEERGQNNIDWPQWLHMVWNMENNEVGSVFSSIFPNSDGTDLLKLQTEDGEMFIDWGDFIIKDINNRISVCNSKLFYSIYEEIIDV